MTGGEAPVLTSAQELPPSRLAQPLPLFSWGRGLAPSPVYPGTSASVEASQVTSAPRLPQRDLALLATQGWASGSGTPRYTRSQGAKEVASWAACVLRAFSGELGDGQVNIGTQTLQGSGPVTCLYGPFVARAKTCDSVLVGTRGSELMAPRAGQDCRSER